MTTSPAFRLPAVLPLSNVLGRGYESWVCHLSAPSPLPSSSVFLTRIGSCGRISPVQLPSTYAAYPNFGLAAFGPRENVSAERLFCRKLDSGTEKWDLWVSALVGRPPPGAGPKTANVFCSAFAGDIYLSAHAVPARRDLPAVPIHFFLLPAMLVGPDSLLS